MNLFNYVLVAITTIIGSFVLAILIAGCGGGPSDVPLSSNGTTTIVGPAGPAGANGSNGVNGLNSLIITMPALSTQCTNGGTVILTGLDKNSDGSLATNEITGSATICNGAQGATGATGATGAQGVQGASGPVSQFSPISPIEPCGANSSPYKEVLLCLYDGNVLSSFSDSLEGDNTRFAFLPTGTFQDTDDSACVFTSVVDSKGDTTISWNAGHNAYSTWNAGSVKCVAN